MEDDEDESDQRESVTVDEIRERAREMARNSESIVSLINQLKSYIRADQIFLQEVKPLDPTDTDWTEAMDDDPDGVKIKVVMHRPNKVATRRVLNAEFDAEVRGLPTLPSRIVLTHPQPPKRLAENDHQKKVWRSWAKDVGHQHKGTGRSANGAAVTGHAKVKGGGGSLRSTSTGHPEAKPGPSKLSKARSMLSTVSDRSSKFG